MADQIHKVAVEKGFYEGEINIGEKLMLIVSEIGEAMEAHRKGKFADDHRTVIEDNNFLKSFEEYIKDTFEDEIADTFIRLLDLCAYMKIDIEKHIQLKNEYNILREYKHGKKY